MISEDDDIDNNDMMSDQAPPRDEGPVAERAVESDDGPRGRDEGGGGQVGDHTGGHLHFHLIGS